MSDAENEASYTEHGETFIESARSSCQDETWIIRDDPLRDAQNVSALSNKFRSRIAVTTLIDENRASAITWKVEEHTQENRPIALETIGKGFAPGRCRASAYPSSNFVRWKIEVVAFDFENDGTRNEFGADRAVGLADKNVTRISPTPWEGTRTRARARASIGMARVRDHLGPERSRREELGVVAVHRARSAPDSTLAQEAILPQIAPQALHTANEE